MRPVSSSGNNGCSACSQLNYNYSYNSKARVVDAFLVKNLNIKFFYVVVNLLLLIFWDLHTCNSRKL